MSCTTSCINLEDQFVALSTNVLIEKVPRYDSLRLSQAQILWGMYHKKNVDYAYLLWEDFVYQVKQECQEEYEDVLYPPSPKVIGSTIFMTKHEDTQLYGATLPNKLTNEDIRNSESFKEYYAIASGTEPPKTKARVKKKEVGSDMSKTPPTKGKRLRISTKAAKTAKKKQPAKTSKAKGLSVLSEVALTEAEQIKLATKRSLIQTHGSHACGSGAYEGTGSIPGVPDVPTYESDDEQISWKSSEEDDDDEVNMSEDDDDDNDDDIDKDDEDDDADNQDNENPDDANQDDDDEQTESDNDGDDFVHPKISTHDDEARQDDVVNEEESNEESDDESNKDSDEEVQGAIIKEKEMDEEATHEENEANELYRDVNVNLEGRDTEMTDAPLPNVQGTQVTEDTHVIITAPVNPKGQQQSSSVSSGFASNMLNPSPDTGIDTIFSLNNEATSLVDVLVTTITETPLLSGTTLPLPPTPLITHLQQTPVPAPATVPRSSLQDLPNFSFLFGFDHILKTLETDFFEFKQTNKFAKAVSSIPDIVDAFSLATKKCMTSKTGQLKLPSPDRDWNMTLPHARGPVQPWLSSLAQERWNLDRMGSGQQYPHDLRKPLPLIHNSHGRRVIPFDHFINNDLEYLSGGVSSRKYATSVTKTKAADYEHIKWIKDLVPNRMWSQVPVSYDKHALWGISHWGRKRQQFYGFAANRESARDVYSKRRIIAVTKLEIVDWHNYKHLEASSSFYTLAGNPVKEILLKLNLPDHRILKDGGEDDHSNYTWVMFVESKDDVLEMFKILCKKLVNLHYCSVVSIVTNHSSEFDKIQFGSFCEQHGMSYNLSGSFTSQSNKIVERTHCKLRKMSRSMLDEQSIPQKFWCHALDTTTYEILRKFTNKTPYEILRNRKPSLEYLRFFGCKVFILNTKVHLIKFDPKSYEGVFLGYSQTSKAYIVIYKETMGIEESFNATFDESLPKPKSSPSVEDDRINEPLLQRSG
ncbi:retrovirus-related pol polyprotein from transposon TNT 1-94 [Tanacetum coccineum]